MVAKKRRGRGAFPSFGAHDPLLDAPVRATLDLHGDTAAEAERRVRDFLLTHARISRGEVVHLITGRGKGSRGRPVLPGVVRRVLASEAVARHVSGWDRDLDEAGFLIRMR